MFSRCASEALVLVSFVMGVSLAGPLVIEPPESSARVIPEPALELTVNFLPNPGFERGVDSALPEYWSRFGNLNRGCPGGGLVKDSPFEGAQCARLAAGETLCVPTEVERVRQNKDSAVDGREPYVLSVYLCRAQPAGETVTCNLGLWGQVDVDDGNPRPELFETACSVTDEWQRFELPVLVDLVLGANRWGIMGALFEARFTANGGDVLVDAIQLEYGKTATPYAGEATVAPAMPPETPAVDDLALVMRGLEQASLSATSVANGTVELSVRRPDGAASRYFATGAVFFARGTLFEGNRVLLYDEAGKAVPLQTQVLARYTMDGAIRSLYVVFPVDGSAGAQPKFTLRYGEEPAEQPVRQPVVVEDVDDQVTVNTGPVKFIMRRNGFRLFEQLWLDANGDGKHTADECVLAADSAGGLTVVDDAGTCWESRLDTPTLVVERSGPLEVVVRAQGWHRDSAGHGKIGYIVRVFAYAGSPELRIEHTFENLTRTKSPGTGLQGIALTLPLRGIVQSAVLADGKTLAAGADFYALQTAVDDEERGTVVTEDDLRATVSGQGRAPVEVSGLDGLFRFATGKAAMALRAEDLGANYPLAVQTGTQGVDVEFWPTRGVKTLLLTHGMAKTHRLWLGFAKSAEDLTGLPGMARAVPDPAYMLATGADTWGCTPERSAFRDVESAIARAFDLQATVIGIVTPIGKFNFGDFPHIHTAQGWGNSETALSRNWLVQAMRTGDERAFRIGERLIRHTVDVDVDHVHGNQYTHNMHHALGGTSHSCHDYAEMMSLYYLLTGDTLVLDINRRNTASSRATVTTKWRKWLTGRAHGWPAWHVAEMGDVTCEKANLDAALTITEHFRDSIQVVDGKRTSLSGQGGLLYGGTNLNALMHIHLATGNPDARAAFLNELDYIIKQARDAGKCQFSGRHSIMADPMLYAWRLTGDRAYIERGIEATEAAAQNDDLYLVNCVPLLAAAAELGIKPSPSPDYLCWGFKRQHTMYISLPKGTPCRGVYRRRETGKDTEWWFKLYSPDGRLVLDRAFEPMQNGDGTLEAPANNADGPWRLDVHQGYPAMVDFAFEGTQGAVLQIDPDMWRFACEPERYWFLVPEDAKEIKIAASKYWGNGTAGLAVYGPDGKLLDKCRWTPEPKGVERAWHELVITPPEGTRGRLWSMVIALYDGQYQLRMEGVPPFVALTPDTYFLPNVGPSR